MDFQIRQSLILAFQFSSYVTLDALINLTELTSEFQLFFFF